MTNEEYEDKKLEIQYWQHISQDCATIGTDLGQIGVEIANKITEDPLSYALAAPLITEILAHLEAIGHTVINMQDLVAGRLTVLEKLAEDG